MGRHGPCQWPVARARRDCTAAGGGRLARAAGPGTATGSLTRNKSQSMYFHKGNHCLSGTGPGYIYVILSNAQPEASGRAASAAAAAPDQQSPTRIQTHWHKVTLKTVTGRTRKPGEQLKCAIIFKIMYYITKNVQTAVKIMKKCCAIALCKTIAQSNCITLFHYLK